jgi:hypothetical protein
MFLEEKNMKRVVVISDAHCGHRAGLTPPKGWVNEERDTKVAHHQHILWDWYVNELEKVKPIDMLVCNGDMIDGKGFRSGSREQLTADMNEQVEWAEECIKQAGTMNIKIVFGTGYHVGIEENFEYTLATKLGAESGNHLWIGSKKNDDSGNVIDFKHKVGSSSIPHGRHTAIAKDRLWNMLWAARDWQPNANVIVRSHVHYHVFSGDSTSLQIVTPALQLPDTEYGARQLSGLVDVGFIEILMGKERHHLSWTPHLLDLRFLKPPVSLV